MFDSIVSHVDKCAGGIAQTEFFYRADGIAQMGFFYADGAVSCVQVFTDNGGKTAQAARARARQKTVLNSDQPEEN